MAGRVGIIEMAPLSQSEINEWNEQNYTVDNDRLYESIVRGFYPARWKIEDKPIKNYYLNYVKHILKEMFLG